jgi:HD superfamily phosphohydrolase YqeK
MDIEMILDRLKKTLDGGRFAHSVNVMEVSVKLAEHYGVDIKKEELELLQHDC